MAINPERFLKAKRFDADFILDDATDKVKHKPSAVAAALNSEPTALQALANGIAGDLDASTAIADATISAMANDPLVAAQLAEELTPELNATAAETIAGTVTDKFIAPDDLKAWAAAGDTTGSALVGFKQAGTGAVDRTLQDKAREVVSVADYGTLAEAQAANPNRSLLLGLGRFGGVPYSKDGGSKKYTFLAGVIRQDSPGSGWYFIDDAGHKQTGFAGTFSVLGRDLLINYGFSASKVVSLIAVPDETFAGSGLVVGASVGTNNTILSFYTPFEMRTNGTSIAVGNNLESGVDVTATFDINAGTCVVTHPTISHVDSGGGFISVEPTGLPDGNQFAGAAVTTKTGFTLNYRNAIAGRVNGAQLATLNTGSSIAWDGTSTLTITHPASGSSLHDIALTPGDSTYTPVCTGSTATTIQVQFKNSAGTIYSGATNPAVFRYLRGGIATSTISGASKLHIRRGLVQARASYVSRTGGNIWLYGVMEEA